MPDSAIACGDFNCSPDSAEYRYLIDNSDLVDSWSVSDPDNRNNDGVCALFPHLPCEVVYWYVRRAGPGFVL